MLFSTTHGWIAWYSCYFILVFHSAEMCIGKYLASSLFIFGPVHVCVAEQTKPRSRQWEFPLKCESARRRKGKWGSWTEAGATKEVQVGAEGELRRWGAFLGIVTRPFWCKLPFDSALACHHGAPKCFCKWRRSKKLFKSWIENVSAPPFQISSPTCFALIVIVKQLAVK